MSPYQVIGQGDDRVLMMYASAMFQYTFKERVGEKLVPVKFKRAGGKLIARVGAEVLAYKKPSANEWHYEYMRNNSRQLSGWGGVDHDQLLDNMLEYIEIL